MSRHGTHFYENITRAKVETIITALADHGSSVTGNNPWSIDTKKHGVRLQGEWNEEASILEITVTHADWYVPSKTLWENIDSLMGQVRDESNNGS